MSAPSVQYWVERYATALGVPLFPCHTLRADGLCSCSNPACPDVAKHPRTAHGFKDATTNQTQLTTWWEWWPDANPAGATGHRFDVLDLDGVDSQTWQREQGYVLPSTWRARTGSGGEHWYFQPAPGLRNRVKRIAHADTRALGGYVLLPPSLHRSGARYRWIVPPGAVPLAPWPSDLLAVLRPPEQPLASTAPRPAGLVARIPASLVAWAERGAPLGQQTNCAFWLACRLRKYGADDAEGCAIMERYAAACTPPANLTKIERIWRDSAKYQGYQPYRPIARAIPPRGTSLSQAPSRKGVPL